MGDEIIWILDDGPLESMTRHANLSPKGNWPTSLYIAEQTAVDAVNDPSGERPRWLAENGGPFRIASVPIGSPATHVLYEHLRREQSGTPADLAEHQAIAWACVEEPRAVFVGYDKRALTLALAELGRERVAHPFDLWSWLLSEDFIELDAFRRLCDSACKKDSGLPGHPWRFRRRFDDAE